MYSFKQILKKSNQNSQQFRGFNSSEVSPLERVIWIYGKLVNELEQTVADLKLQQLSENCEDANLKHFLESSTITNLGEQFSVIKGYRDDLRIFQNSIEKNIPIDSRILSILDKLRDRAIKAMRTIGNFIFNSKSEQDKVTLTNFLEISQTVINETLSILRMHPRLVNDSSFKNIDKSDIVPKSADKKTSFSTIEIED